MNILKLVKSSNSKIINANTKENFIMGKDEILEPKTIKIFGIYFTLNIYYLKIKSPELNIQKNIVNIFLPIKLRKQNNQILLNNILLKMYTKITENEVEIIMEKARHQFGYAPEDYNIYKIPGALATFNKELQSITINPYISMYSKDIIEYIVFHEFCHLKYKTHSKKFYVLLEKNKPNYKVIEEQIQNLKY